MAFNKKFVVGIMILFSLAEASSIYAVGLCEPCSDSVCDTSLTCVDGRCCKVGEICFCNPLHATAFEELVDNIINFVFYVGIAIVPIMFVISGFYFTTAGGDSNRINTAKTIALWTSVGLFIILFAKGIIAVIRALFQG